MLNYETPRVLGYCAREWPTSFSEQGIRQLSLREIKYPDLSSAQTSISTGQFRHPTLFTSRRDSKWRRLTLFSLSLSLFLSNKLLCNCKVWVERVFFTTWQQRDVRPSVAQCWNRVRSERCRAHWQNASQTMVAERVCVCVCVWWQRLIMTDAARPEK